MHCHLSFDIGCLHIVRCIGLDYVLIWDSYCRLINFLDNSFNLLKYQTIPYNAIFNLQCLRTNDYTTLVMLSSCATANLPFCIWLCSVGENITTSFGNLNEQIYGVAWYQCPVKTQKYILPMIIASQPAVEFRGFFSMGYSHDTFKRVSASNVSHHQTTAFDRNWRETFGFSVQVINLGYSYFMMLQRMLPWCECVEIVLIHLSFSHREIV